MPSFCSTMLSMASACCWLVIMRKNSESNSLDWFRLASTSSMTWAYTAQSMKPGAISWTDMLCRDSRLFTHVVNRKLGGRCMRASRLSRSFLGMWASSCGCRLTLTLFRRIVEKTHAIICSRASVFPLDALTVSSSDGKVGSSFDHGDIMAAADRRCWKLSLGDALTEAISCVFTLTGSSSRQDTASTWHRRDPSRTVGSSVSAVTVCSLSF
mmetsp:Transcript_33331/g.83750  ORF Transcript_33331/g.83750 Transcript_33331/m.83750 type:complete len:212 (-) Transcript_33331:623-1258(-)